MVHEHLLLLAPGVDKRHKPPALGVEAEHLHGVIEFLIQFDDWTLHRTPDVIRGAVCQAHPGDDWIVVDFYGSTCYVYMIDYMIVYCLYIIHSIYMIVYM